MQALKSAGRINVDFESDLESLFVLKFVPRFQIKIFLGSFPGKFFGLPEACLSSSLCHTLNTN